MSFLAPLLLVALPLAALPILIHLINQRRFQNIDWAAMRFLLEANRMSRGFARIRQWLILLLRALAIAALIFAVARPLARGRLGSMAGDPVDTTLILLDRSASMNQRARASDASKLETGVGQLADLLGKLRSARWVVIDSVSLAPQSLASPEGLRSLPTAAGTSASADVPALLQAAHDYVRTNRTGRTEVWLCSDLRAGDWNAASGQWATLREAFGEMPQGVRFHLLAYPEVGAENVAVRVTDVRREETASGARLLVSLTLSGGGFEGERSVPVVIETGGARLETVVEMDGQVAAVRDHPIPIEAGVLEGWGRVSIPADINPADNEFHFVFAQPPERRTVIVTDEPTPLRAVELAAAIAPDAAAPSAAEFVDPDQVVSVAWEEVALLVWRAPLPQGDDARIVRSFVDRGGQAIFLPPGAPDDTELFGVKWTRWREPDEPTSVENWRSDQDLLRRTQSGDALPVGELSVRRYCGMDGELTPLATLYDGAPLFARAGSRTGGVYFLATTTAPGDSTLATGGVVLYAAVQRALESGVESLSKARQVDAGARDDGGVQWRQVAGAPEALSTEYPHHAGVYAAGEALLAVNRGEAEDSAEVLDDERVEGLFQGLDFDRIDGRAGDASSLAREVWRLFLVSMALALIGEVGLCLPKRRDDAGGLV